MPVWLVRALEKLAFRLETLGGELLPLDVC